MATIVNNHDVREPLATAVVSSPSRVVRVFIPLITPFLYGMERAVIELFDQLRPEVEPYFLQSSRIFQRQPPIIREMLRRGFSIELLPDKTDWERLAKPKSLKHFCQMILTFCRINLAILKGVRGKDVLYIPGISTGSSSLLAAVYCRLTGRRVIHHFHDLGTTNRLFRLWIPLVTDFVHNTEFAFRAVTANLPAVRRKRNFIVSYIMEIDGRLPDDPQVCRALKAQRNLFFVGQISRHKGVDLLIDAFKQVAAKHSDVMLHLVGEGREDFRAELDQQIASDGLQHRVKFWGFREDATRLMRFADIYVHTSPPSRFHESFGRSVVESMAQGVPTVCFRSGSLQEIVLHRRTGLMVEEDSDKLADAINCLLEDSGFRDRCAAIARDRFEKVYSKEAVTGRWRQVFLPKVEVLMELSRRAL